MPILVACPSCQRQLRVQDALIGKRVKCPGCGMTFAAQPAGSSAAPPAPPPRVPMPAPPMRPPVQPAVPPPEEVVDYRGEQQGYDEYDEREERRLKKKRKARRAAERLKIPAIFMIILGCMGIVFLIISTILMAAGMGLAAAAAADMPRNQPPPGLGPRPGRPQIEDDFPTKMRDIMAVGAGVTIILGIAGVILHGLMVLGAVFMLRARGYGMAITGTIMCMLAGFFGCFGGGVVGGAIFAPCGCLAIVFIPIYLGIGIWSLVVLMSADVKAAFA